jgi:hypothetical protein
VFFVLARAGVRGMLCSKPALGEMFWRAEMEKSWMPGVKSPCTVLYKRDDNHNLQGVAGWDFFRSYIHVDQSDHIQNAPDRPVIPNLIQPLNPRRSEIQHLRSFKLKLTADFMVINWSGKFSGSSPLHFLLHLSPIRPGSSIRRVGHACMSFDQWPARDIYESVGT